jgi:hypothetical protein
VCGNGPMFGSFIFYKNTARFIQIGRKMGVFQRQISG